MVEVLDERPVSRPVEPGSSGGSNDSPRPFGGSQRPFGRGIPIRSIRIPVWLWPLAIILGIVLFLLAVVVGLIVAIPFLILRALYRLLLAPSR